MVKKTEPPSRRRTARIRAWGMVGVAAALFAGLAWWEPSLEKEIPGGSPGEIRLGKALYRRNCAICHGHDAQGIWSQKAPRAAGMSDWYLQRQLKNFQDGLRGAHPRDSNGLQMSLMADTLHDDQAIDDVIAYINTL